MTDYSWMKPYLTTPPDQVAAAMRTAGAKGHLVSGQERFYIDWPGGCHMSTPGTKNDPPWSSTASRRPGTPGPTVTPVPGTHWTRSTRCLAGGQTQSRVAGNNPGEAGQQSRTGRQGTGAPAAGSRCWRQSCAPIAVSVRPGQSSIPPPVWDDSCVRSYLNGPRLRWNRRRLFQHPLHGPLGRRFHLRGASGALVADGLAVESVGAQLPDSPAEDALRGLLGPGNGVALGLQFTCPLPCSVYCSPLAS